jgi:prevent-host-death family protein
MNEELDYAALKADIAVDPATFLPIAEAKDNLSELVNQAYYAGVTTIIEKRGRPQAVLLSYKTYLLIDQLLQEYDDKVDIKEAELSIEKHNSNGAPTVTIDEFVKDNIVDAKVQSSGHSSGGKAISQNRKPNSQPRSQPKPVSKGSIPFVAKNKKRTSNKPLPRQSKPKPKRK